MLTSREYRLPSDKETEDEAHLSPHTPVATDINDSYPNSDREEEGDMVVSDRPVSTRMPRTDSPKSATTKTASENTSSNGRSTQAPVPKPSGKGSLLGCIKHAAMDHWPAMVTVGVAIVIGVYVVAKRSK